MKVGPLSIFTDAIRADASHTIELMERGSRPCESSADGQHEWVSETSKWIRTKKFNRCRKCRALEPPEVDA